MTTTWKILENSNPPPAAPQRRESAVVGEQLPMIGFVQGICMRLAGTSGTSSTAWDNFRPTKKKNNFYQWNTIFPSQNIIIMCGWNTIFNSQKTISGEMNSIELPFTQHRPSISPISPGIHRAPEIFRNTTACDRHSRMAV